LTQAMGIGKDEDGIDMVNSELLFFEESEAPVPIEVGLRVGVRRGTRFPWRFLAKGSLFISKGS